ncbi:MAG: cyclopropane-fatty-acyl-phospholipid synthase family protein [Pseudomonadota bacterium]
MRFGMRRLMAQRIRAEQGPTPEARDQRLRDTLASLAEGAIAIRTDAANEQHYEVPPAFFEAALGKHLKYSSCYWPAGTQTLDDAERHMLELTCERAGIEDGMRVLDLGCGWGSLSLWVAQQYPACRIVSVSNSGPQKAFIDARAAALGLDNVTVITADINDFVTSERFDRVVSVEMFEHLRNYAGILERIESWLKPDGRLFVHIFCHDHLLYPFENRGKSDWMARYFFTGGMMPAFDTLPSFDAHLRLIERWRVNGHHYALTADAWLANLDARRAQVMPVLEATYGARDAGLWFHRWRMFFLAVSELFDFSNGKGRGEEWFVGHYLFGR